MIVELWMNNPYKTLSRRKKCSVIYFKKRKVWEYNLINSKNFNAFNVA